MMVDCAWSTTEKREGQKRREAREQNNRMSEEEEGQVPETERGTEGIMLRKLDRNSYRH